MKEAKSGVAPDLLAAIKELKFQYGLALNELSNYGIIRPKYEKALFRAKVAIAKAEGNI